MAIATATDVNERLSVTAVTPSLMEGGGVDSNASSTFAVEEQGGVSGFSSESARSAEDWAGVFRRAYGVMGSGGVVDAEILGAPRRGHAGMLDDSEGPCLLRSCFGLACP